MSPMSSGGSRWGRVVSPSRRTSLNAHRISDCGASCQRADNRFDLPAARRSLRRRSGWVDGGSQLPCCQRDATLRAGHPETHAVGEPGCSISTDSAGRVSQLWCSCSCALRGSSAAGRCIDAGQCRRRAGIQQRERQSRSSQVRSHRCGRSDCAFERGNSSGGERRQHLRRLVVGCHRELRELDRAAPPYSRQARRQHGLEPYRRGRPDTIQRAIPRAECNRNPLTQ